MIAIVKYSDLLTSAFADTNELCNNISTLRAINGFDAFGEIIENQLEVIINTQKYKYLSINVIRNGLPLYNIRGKSSEQIIEPYSICDAYKQMPLAEYVKENEYKIYKKLENRYKNDINFIYVKHLYEDDVISYFKKFNMITDDLLKLDTQVFLPNTNNSSLTFDECPFINVLRLDEIINEI